MYSYNLTRMSFRYSFFKVLCFRLGLVLSMVLLAVPLRLTPGFGLGRSTGTGSYPLVYTGRATSVVVLAL
jgi:hypothetical protein